MTWKRMIWAGVLAASSTPAAFAQQPAPAPVSPYTPGSVGGSSGFGPGTGASPGGPEAENFGTRLSDDPAPTVPAPYGPAGFTTVNILNNLIYGDGAKDAKIKFGGWADFDYTYRSTGGGINNVAPVMNRFGNEALVRQLGLYIYKPLDAKELSWGFNAMFIAGADAFFLQPLAGGWRSTDPRFGSSFTDLNLTAHLPILTEGGVDIKAGRQTTVIGSQGAQSWARVFNSSDYAWFIMEEGRYTGVSANWIINKQLSWYNGIQVGGWGTFFDYGGGTRNINYIGQVNYWLDCEAKQTKVWASTLYGPTGQDQRSGDTLMVELAMLHNYNERVYQIFEFQSVYSKAPVFGRYAPGQQQRSYDLYTILGYHLNKCVDVNSRLEFFKDCDGLRYPGGFGQGKNNYYAATLGLDYHPVNWLQIRPEIRYDQADQPAYGEFNNKRKQFSASMDCLFKF